MNCKWTDPSGSQHRIPYQWFDILDELNQESTTNFGVGELAGGGEAAAAAGTLRRAAGLQATRPPQRQRRRAETRARPWVRWDPTAGESRRCRCRCAGERGELEVPSKEGAAALDAAVHLFIILLFFLLVLTG